MTNGEEEGRSGNERGGGSDGTQRWTGACEITDREAPEGNRLGRGEEAMGGQGQGGGLSEAEGMNESALG